MRLIYTFLVLLQLYTGLVYSVLNLNLGDFEWKVKNGNGSIDVPATVPGGIYSDLMTNNIIGDIFYGYTDTEVRWVARTNWTYYTQFSLDVDLLQYENLNIVFEGLDTISTVKINDVVVGESDNMFVRYIFNITSVLKSGKNSIEVEFFAPVEAAANLADSHPYLVPPQCVPDVYRGECHVNFLRKMQASFSWDWGPAFPSVGIWKNVSIEAFNTSTIRYVVVNTNVDKYYWTLDVTTFFANNQENHVTGQLFYYITGTDMPITFSSVVDAVPNEDGEITNSVQVRISVDKVKAWWPNGYGDQVLYNLKTIYTDDSYNSVEKTIRIGFRTVELVQDTLDSGLTFYFKVNDVPIYMKGSNAIPMDLLPELDQKKTTIERVLQDARDTHQNMIRVWGGGLYESDYFYDIADEYGILIWQDFMFASSMYPTNEEFLASVTQEVRHQVNRLRSHACLALFAGNNENEGNLRSGYFGTNDNYTLYYNDYVKLYVDTVKAEFDRLTENRTIFLLSSPTNGLKTIEEGYVAQEPGSSRYGDMHSYTYNSDTFEATSFPIGRFISEYGSQAFPSVESLLTATDDESNLMIGSDWMNNRQHHPNGNDQMKGLIERQFKLPSENSSNYYKAFIFYNQIVQAMTIKVQSERNRNYRTIIGENGAGNTMGSLYWQLNDVWLAPTWSGIDYLGKWKPLQYFVQKFFAPVLIAAEINTERFARIFVISDLMTDKNATVLVQVYNWSSFTPLSSQSMDVNLAGGSAQLISSFDADKLLSDNKCGSTSDAKNNCFFYFVMDTKDGDHAENFLFPGKIKDSNITTPTLTIDSVKAVDDDKSFEITLKTDKVALFVWLDAPGIEGRFSENGWIQITQTKTVTFVPKSSASLDDLKKQLTVTNLFDKQYL